MPIYEYSREKDELLRKTRHIGFAQIIEQMECGNTIRVVDHPNQERYPGQSIISVEIDNYICAVPAVIRGEHVFLKTIYPSRKLNKRAKRRR